MHPFTIHDLRCARRPEARVSRINRQSSIAKERASVLVGLLWCLALLSVVVIGVLHTTRMDLIVTKNYGDRIQAHYLAVAGIERAKALLYRDATERSRSRQNHDGQLYDDPTDFHDISLGRGSVQIFRRGSEENGGGIIYGISDEESRLNINTASREEFEKITDMTPDVVAAILDWRDTDNQVTPNGAEADYYASLQPPRLPRNGPFQTIRELLMVRGMPTDLLLGNDVHDDGLLEAESDNGQEVFVHQTVSDSDLGWARLFTVNSSIKNVNAAGDDRVDVQTADESSLTAIKGITPEIARAIISYRGQHQFQSIADLLDVTEAQNQPEGGTNRTSRAQRPQGAQNNNSSGSGRRMISADLLVDIADDVTANSSPDLAGVVNVNTAGLDVLRCLPGVDRQLAQAIISFRKSDGFFPNTAALLRVPGMTENTFKQIASLVSVRSETFRILSEGRVTSSGVSQRIQEIVHISLNDITTLSHREDDL